MAQRIRSISAVMRTGSQQRKEGGRMDFTSIALAMAGAFIAGRVWDDLEVRQ